MPYTNGLRYESLPGQNNQYVIPSRRLVEVAYVATLNLTPQHEEVKILMKQLTGAVTVNSSITSPFAGDTLILQFQADASPRIVTFATGFVTNSTLTVAASKVANIRFTFCGLAQTWVEVSRFIQS